MRSEASTKRADKRSESELKNNLRAIRSRLGLSQVELAQRAGVARQTIGGIEAALYAPSAAVSLRLARALGCLVEDIFWLEDEPAPTLLATRAQVGRGWGGGSGPGPQEERVALGQVGGRWVAHVLGGDAAFCTEMRPADAVTLQHEGCEVGEAAGEAVEVQLLDSLDSLGGTVFVAGCSPALSLWTGAAQRWHPGLRAQWVHANSTQALQALARGEVHIAGVHLCDPEGGEDNVPFVRALAGEGEIVLLNFGTWDEGLLLPGGNPQSIRGLGDLPRPEVRFLNREAGAGSRLLLDAMLAQEKVPANAIRGYGEAAGSHRGVARAIRDKRADVGMGTAAMARIYGLGFLPLRSVRFDFAVRAKYLEEEPVRQLLEALGHKSVRQQLQKLGGYDTSRTGDVIARLVASTRQG